MAVIKLGALISDIRGKLQNGVYSLAKGGVHYVKNIPASVTNPNSEDQAAVRFLFQKLAKIWYDALTPAQRVGWEEMAQILDGLVSDDNGGILNLVPAIGMKGSGFNAFVGFQTRAQAAGVGPVLDAPLGETQPLPPTMLDLTYAPSTATVTWTPPIIADPGAMLAVWFKSHQRLYHKQIVGYVAPAAGTFAFGTARAVLGNWLLFTASTPFESIVQLQTINPSGWASPGSETKEVLCT